MSIFEIAMIVRGNVISLHFIIHHSEFIIPLYPTIFSDT
jgi:hypothetical protein